MLPCRLIYGLQDLFTLKHVDNMAKIILLTGTIVGYAYIMELFISYYSANKFESDAFHLRILSGPYTWAYYLMFFCNVIAPQVFWFEKARKNLWVVFIVANFVNAGMWFERFVIIPTAVSVDFLPAQWGLYSPTWVEKLMFAGSFGLFMSLFLIFLRFLPVIAIAEVKGVLPQADAHYHDWKKLKESRRIAKA